MTAGKYDLAVELIGYHTFSKECDIFSAPGWDVDLGTIGMEESMERIDAAKITIAGNPITIENDTLVYNASSYSVGENAVLEDLLEKMPGMEVGSDGSVTVNGEKVSRITVACTTAMPCFQAMGIKTRLCLLQMLSMLMTAMQKATLRQDLRMTVLQTLKVLSQVSAQEPITIPTA